MAITDNGNDPPAHIPVWKFLMKNINSSLVKVSLTSFNAGLVYIRM